jgi:hypothetical protein
MYNHYVEIILLFFLEDINNTCTVERYLRFLCFTMSKTAVSDTGRDTSE